MFDKVCLFVFLFFLCVCFFWGVACRDSLLGWTFETNGTDSSRRLFQKSVRVGRGGGPWTDSRDGLLGWTFEPNGAFSLRRLFQMDGRSWRASGTDFWNKWHGVIAPIVSKVCPWGRFEDGRPWREGILKQLVLHSVSKIWNKWYPDLKIDPWNVTLAW